VAEFSPGSINGGSLLSAALRHIQHYSFRTAQHKLWIFAPAATATRAAEAYISMRRKRKAFEAAGFRTQIIERADDPRLATLAAGDMYLRQRPEDPALASRILEGAVNLDRLVSRGPAISAVAEAAGRILEACPALERRSVAVVGAGGAVGRDLMLWLEDRGLPARGFDLGDGLDALEDHEIIVSATGVPHLITAARAGRLFLAIDVGFHYRESSDEILGDFAPAALSRARYYTPVPGGMGPLQVLTLLERALAHIGGIPYSPWSVTLAPGALPQGEGQHAHRLQGNRR